MSDPAPAYDYPTTYPAPAAEPPAPGVGPVHYPPPIPQYQAVAVPVAYPPGVGTNAMSIAALVCSLVLAPLGIVFGHIALSQIKRSGEDGRGLAIAGLVIGYIFTAVALLWIIVTVVFIGAVASTINESTYDGYSTYSMKMTGPTDAALP
ncbi:DUF4190 domain-containing protein [Mycolicibacterium diernhoferi]|uniref:DUF4190 domain-containing protein n=1 Tax=Mycolicibacterium diernhoferi TaxID=1801 RepID=UPI001F438A5D|nr:DUF4190 domain-containing protein [Mycolicibacterium diernhoferi]